MDSAAGVRYDTIATPHSDQVAELQTPVCALLCQKAYTVVVHHCGNIPGVGKTRNTE